MMVAGLILSGCGDSGESNKKPAAATASQTSAAKPAQSDSGVTKLPAMAAFSDNGKVVDLTLEGNDLMQYNVTHFELKPGQMVRLTLKHVGKLPAQNMGHNFVLLKLGQDVAEFSADVNENGGSIANNYVPPKLLDRVIAYTKLIGGGQTTTVEFRAPEEPGKYPFLCSFPGHAGMMNGIVEIKP